MSPSIYATKRIRRSSALGGGCRVRQAEVNAARLCVWPISKKLEKLRRAHTGSLSLASAAPRIFLDLAVPQCGTNQRYTAVHRKHRTGNIVRQRRGQKYCGPADVIGCSRPPQWQS